LDDTPRGIEHVWQGSGDFLRKRKRMAMSKRDWADREAAESLAIQALTYLAGEPERLGRFLALCGLGPEQVRLAATQPGFLAGVLEYLSSDESLLLGFADHARVDPAEIARAQAALSGHRWEREIP
jgi:hypothetical protein